MFSMFTHNPAALAVAVVIGFAGVASAQELSDYGTEGSWILRRDSAVPALCDAIMFDGSEHGLRMVYSADSTGLAFMGDASAVSAEPLDVMMWFDGDKANAQTLSLAMEEETPGGFGWRTYRASNSEPDGILDLFLNSSAVTVEYEDQGRVIIETYPLDGSLKAFSRTTDCINQQTSAPSEQSSSPKVIYGSCTLVVDGVTYIDRPKDCPIWLANDGTGDFWINTDRDSYLGDYFAEMSPQAGGIGWGYWNAEKGATHAQAPLGEDFRMTKGGCWENARAKVCAAK